MKLLSLLPLFILLIIAFGGGTMKEVNSSSLNPIILDNPAPKRGIFYKDNRTYYLSSKTSGTYQVESVYNNGSFLTVHDLGKSEPWSLSGYENSLYISFLNGTVLEMSTDGILIQRLQVSKLSYYGANVIYFSHYNQSSYILVTSHGNITFFDSSLNFIKTRNLVDISNYPKISNKNENSFTSGWMNSTTLVMIAQPGYLFTFNKGNFSIVDNTTILNPVNDPLKTFVAYLGISVDRNRLLVMVESFGGSLQHRLYSIEYKKIMGHKTVYLSQVLYTQVQSTVSKPIPPEGFNNIIYLLIAAVVLGAVTLILYIYRSNKEKEDSS